MHQAADAHGLLLFNLEGWNAAKARLWPRRFWKSDYGPGDTQEVFRSTNTRPIPVVVSRGWTRYWVSVQALKQPAREVDRSSAWVIGAVTWIAQRTSSTCRNRQRSNVYQPAGRIEDFFRQVDSYSCEKPIHEVMQFDQFHRLFEEHGMELTGPPRGGDWKVRDERRVVRIS